MPPRTTARAVAALCLALAVAGCCREEFAGALVVNDTDQPVELRFEGSQEGPWVVAPGADTIAPGPPGQATLLISAPQGVTRRAVELRLEDLALVTASADGCLVMADYTAHYEGDGQVKLLARSAPDAPGRVASLPFQGTTYYGPHAPLPASIRDDEQVIRFTPTPCALLRDDAALQRHLYPLP
jgi:hypothetical protein